MPQPSLLFAGRPLHTPCPQKLQAGPPEDRSSRRAGLPHLSRSHVPGPAAPIPPLRQSAGDAPAEKFLKPGGALLHFSHTAL